MLACRCSTSAIPTSRWALIEDGAPATVRRVRHGDGRRAADGLALDDDVLAARRHGARPTSTRSSWPASCRRSTAAVAILRSAVRIHLLVADSTRPCRSRCASTSQPRPAPTGSSTHLPRSRLHGAPAIVVDFGTATTFDVVAADGALHRRRDRAGLRAWRSKRSHARTAQLPRVDAGRCRRARSARHGHRHPEWRGDRLHRPRPRARPRRSRASSHGDGGHATQGHPDRRSVGSAGGRPRSPASTSIDPT